MNTHDIELPPEFQSGNSVPVSQATIKRERMEEILRSAIEAERQRRGEPVAWPTHEFAIVVDRIYEGEGPSLAMWNGENYNFADGDCYDRDPDGSLDGYTAEWLTHHQLEQRLFPQQPAEPDYKQLFEQMCERCDALDAKLAEYSEREPVAWVARSPGRTPQYFDGARAAHVYCGTGEWTISPLYDAPQYAEPVKVPSDDEVLEAMRPSLDEGDGGYICDMSPMHVIASGRALLVRYGSKS